jgi:hypothetical protein
LLWNFSDLFSGQFASEGANLFDAAILHEKAAPPWWGRFSASVEG